MIADFKKSVLNFLEHQKGETAGYFKFSYSGDIYAEQEQWGLGASAFAAKIYAMLGELDTLDGNYKKEWIQFIKQFANQKGEIADPLILKKSALSSKLSALRRGYFGNFFNEETRRAETRQSFATLEALGARPDITYANLPKSEKEIKQYIHSLNWRKNPWSAGSHVGHLLFFLRREQKWFGINREQEINEVIKEVNTLQASDGSWHTNDALPNYERVNAAMKVIAGLVAADKPNFLAADKLIDLCLAEKGDKEACSKVDRIYVLYWASQLTDYRKTDIQAFTERKLRQYEEQLRPEGGFSFYPSRAQDFYYGARVTKGLSEPDIHGTVLSVWGYVMLNKLLGTTGAQTLNLPIV